MNRRKKLFLCALAAEFVIIIAAMMSNQTPSVPRSQASPTIPSAPPHLLVVPEAPYGTIAIVIACFLALAIASRKLKVESS